MDNNVKYYEVTVFSSDEYYEKEVTDILHTDQKTIDRYDDMYGFPGNIKGDGREWKEYYTEEEFMDEFDEEERAEMLEDYKGWD